MYFEVDISLEELGLDDFTICMCGQAHRNCDVVVVDFLYWGRDCEVCHEEFKDSTAELFSKDLPELIESDHWAVSQV